MTDATYTAHAYNAVAPAAREILWVSMLKATPLYLFATAIHAALRFTKR